MHNNIKSDKIDWWNEIALKLNGYQANYNVLIDGESGEDDFITMVKNKIKDFPFVLDIGCADGKFTTDIATEAAKVVGIDLSPVMIAKAKSLVNTKAEFIVADARRLPFENDCFDLIVSRRGPVSMPEFLEEAVRVTKPGGHLIEITIGDQDAIEFKRIFNRGQSFEDNQSRYVEIKHRLEDNNRVRLRELREYYSEAYYPTIEDVIHLLSSTPIIDDFDLRKDRRHIEAIQEKCTTEKGIRRTYHRLIWVAEKMV